MMHYIDKSDVHTFSQMSDSYYEVGIRAVNGPVGLMDKILVDGNKYEIIGINHYNKWSPEVPDGHTGTLYLRIIQE